MTMNALVHSDGNLTALESSTNAADLQTGTLTILSVTGGRARKLANSEPVPDWVWRLPVMREALASRDIREVFRILQQRTGLSQRNIAKRTGQSQSEISEVMSGRHIVSYDVLVRIAEGLGIPRGYLGLAFLDQDGPRSASEVATDPVTVRYRDVCPRCAGARPVIGRWTGFEIRALRVAKRMSVREFAAYLGVSDRMVSKWEAGGTTVAPRPLNQAALDTALALSDNETLHRFTDALAQVAAVQPVVTGGGEGTDTRRFGTSPADH